MLKARSPRPWKVSYYPVRVILYCFSKALFMRLFRYVLVGHMLKDDCYHIPEVCSYQIEITLTKAKLYWSNIKENPWRSCRSVTPYMSQGLISGLQVVRRLHFSYDSLAFVPVIIMKIITKYLGVAKSSTLWSLCIASYCSPFPTFWEIL